MKLTPIGLMAIFLLLTGFNILNKQHEYQPSKGEQLVNSILANTAKIIKEKYSIKPCGIGVSMPGGPIQEVTLCFNTKSPYTKKQLRELLIKSANELLNEINKNDQIQQFLNERPFTIRNVQIIIYNHDESGIEVYDPCISGAQVAQGILTFRTVDKSNTFRFKQEFEESYEDALKALH